MRCINDKRTHQLGAASCALACLVGCGTGGERSLDQDLPTGVGEAASANAWGSAADEFPPSEEDLTDHSGYRHETDPEVLEQERLAELKHQEILARLATQQHQGLQAKSLEPRYSTVIPRRLIRGVAYRGDFSNSGIWFQGPTYTYDREGHLWLGRPDNLTPDVPLDYDLPDDEEEGRFFFKGRWADVAAVARAPGGDAGSGGTFLWMKDTTTDELGFHGWVMAGTATQPHSSRKPYEFFFPEEFTPSQLVGVAINKHSNCYYYWKDGEDVYRTVGTSRNATAHSSGKDLVSRGRLDETTIAGIAIAKSEDDEVFTWWRDGQYGIAPNSLQLW